jgi:protein SCO1/2
MTVLQRRLTPEERRKIFFLSVTVDPEVDTPAVLRTYAKRNGVDLASWAFLTESPTAVREVWQSFGMTVNERAKAIVDHPGWTFLIDRKGMVRYRYLGGVLEVETVLEDIRKL